LVEQGVPVLFNRIKNYLEIILLLFLIIIFISCPATDDPGPEPSKNIPADITFINYTAYKVDVYKNLNPEHFDPTTLICTLGLGESKKVEVYASADEIMGDVFFPRYKRQLANSYETGTSNIFVDAERTLPNERLVVKSGGKYTISIPRPKPEELRFVNGYIRVYNNSPSPIEMRLGTVVLPRLDNGEVYILAGQWSYFELPFSIWDSVSMEVTALKAFDTNDVPVPAFTLERGKLYSFTVKANSVTGPEIRPILSE
jgi:hypothetical protein